MQSITCSAPAKVLLAGGYLVLEPNHSGLVLSLSARIYTTVTSLPSSDRVSVSSPQFKDALWEFEIKGNRLCPADKNDNTFVREAVVSALSYFGRLQEGNFNEGISIEIYADNQYYSLPPQDGKRFSSCSTSISESPKTGLGSSAALVTSVIASLYCHFSKISSLEESDKWRIHNLSQLSHSKAQGKVGSGFDVASATFGSCIYSRFPASLIAPVLSTSSPQDGSHDFHDLINRMWPMSVDSVSLLPMYKLLMGDIAQGSSTPGMVKKVLACPSALDLWPSLAIANELLIEGLTVQVTAEESMKETTKSVRALMKQMGKVAGVDIEPDEQSVILDRTLEIPGVVSCGVPGAGGFDAIFAVIRHESGQVESRVCELWESHGITLLNVHSVNNGIVVETNFHT